MNDHDGKAMNFDCLDCVRPVVLTRGGRCPWCGSNAIASSSGTNLEALKRSMHVAEMKELYAIGR